MVRIHSESRIEIWSDSYINGGCAREPGDRNVSIVQIEPIPSSAHSFIVEVIDDAELK